MNLCKKITITFVLVVLTASFSIYGVWEDKMTFLSILIPALYTTLAAWCAWSIGRGAWRRKKTEDGRQKTEDRDQRSDDQITAHSPQSTVYKSSSMIPPGGIMLLLFWAYSALLIPFSVIPYEAKISTLRLGCYIGTYCVVANILKRFPQRKTVWCTLLIALLAVALYSLVQHKIAPNMIFGAERYTDHYWPKGRLAGTYICPNHIAHLFQMWIPLCLVALFIPQFGWFWRICFGYALPVFLLLIYRTQSRASLLGTIAATGMLFLLLMLRKSRRAFLIALIAAPLLMAGGLGGLWLGSAMFRERMQPVIAVVNSAANKDWETMLAADWRPQTWADSMAMFTEHPLFGFGPGNYGMTYPEYRHRIISNKSLTVHPHSEPIELLTEYGAVGAVLFVSALIAFCIPLIRLIKTSTRLYHVLPAAACLAALAGTLVHGLFDFELRIFPNALMLSVLAGCAAAPLLQQSDRPKRSAAAKTRI